MSVFRRFLSYYKPYRHFFVMDTICAIVLSIIDLSFPQIIRRLPEGLFSGAPEAILSSLKWLFPALVFWYLIRALCQFYVTSYGHIMGTRMETDMRQDLFDQYMRLSYAYYDRNNTGEMMSRLVSDLFDISELAHHGPENLILCTMKIVGSFILNKTYFGRNVYAMGSNPDAVALSGVSVAKMRILIFALAGFFFGVAQIVNIGVNGGAMNQGLGIGSEFTVMAGAMLGGIKMGGGGGKMSNMVIGVLIIGLLDYGMTFLNINQYWKYVVLGIALLAAVTIDTLQTRAAANAAKKVTGSAPAAK